MLCYAVLCYGLLPCSPHLRHHSQVAGYTLTLIVAPDDVVHDEAVIAAVLVRGSHLSERRLRAQVLQAVEGILWLLKLRGIVVHILQVDGQLQEGPGRERGCQTRKVCFFQLAAN